MRVDRQRRWWSRRPRLAVLTLLLLPLLVVVVVLGVRALLVLFSIGPRGEYWTERAEQPGEIAYIALGDSLTQGIGSSSPETSFVSVLADDLERRTGSSVRVVNLSVTGSTTSELAAEQLPALDEVRAELEADGIPLALVTLCIGANDVGSRSPEGYRHELGPVLDALPPGAYVADLPDFGGGPRLEDAIALSAAAREEVNARDDLVLVPLEQYTAGPGFREYAGDFFHPSDRGYERYIAAFRAVIDPAPADS